jgi:hypothetical protein
MEAKLSYEEFFKRSVLKLRNTEKSRGIHSVYSGFNQAFREYYNEDPIPVTQELVKQGKIVTRPVKGGAMIYLPDEAPAQPQSALSRILAGVPADRKLTHEEFFQEAIANLRTPGKSRGIHSVFSGFNQAFRDYFSEDPIAVTQRLAADGKIVTRPVKGGAMIYLPEEAPQQPKSVLAKILE